MAIEKYGSVAEIVASQAQAGVDSSTRLYFFGSAPSASALNKIISVSSMAEANTKLGVAAGDGYSLTDACLAAFSIVGVASINCICVSNSAAYAASWIGNAAAETGVYVYEKELRENPPISAILCAPGVSDGSFLAALLSECKAAEGFKSYMIYDIPVAAADFAESGFPDPDRIMLKKVDMIQDEYASCVWGNAEMADHSVVSGAAIRACLMAKSDADYGCPARVGGNLPIDSIISLAYIDANEEVAKFEMRKAEGDALSTNGICSMLNRYGSFYSWGDHTSKFINDSVSDERGRFENTMRILMFLNNWFIRTFANIIDDNMTLQLKNDILGVVQTKLDNMSAIGGVVGVPKCDFVPSDNPTDSLAQGHFVFRLSATAALPVKYLKAKIQYTDEGLSVYTQE